MLAPDLFDGTAAQVQQFKNQIGGTFTFLQQGAIGTGTENFFTVYGDRDSYCVINKQGIVRYNAWDHWPYGNRFHLDELRGTIDSLLTVTTDVGDGPGRALDVVPEPNPSRGEVSFAITNPAGGEAPARIEVCDLAGRTVAVLLDGTVPGGLSHARWSGNAGGGPVAPGLYFVKARIGGSTLVRRIARVR